MVQINGGSRQIAQIEPVHPAGVKVETVVAVVLTSNLRLVDAPGNVLIHAKVAGLPKDSVANVSPIIMLDRDFLDEQAGKLQGPILKKVENGLRLVLGL